jgi:hypothetical protein
LAEDALNHGKEPAAVADPVVEAVGAFEEEFAALGVGFGVGEFAEAFDFVASAVEVGADLFADEAANEAFKFHSGFVVGASFGAAIAVAIPLSLADCAEAFESAKALAGRAFADFQVLDQVVERERILGNEEESVNFANRRRQAKHADAIDEDREDFAFDWVDFLPGAMHELLHDENSNTEGSLFNKI